MGRWGKSIKGHTWGEGALVGLGFASVFVSLGKFG